MIEQHTQAQLEKRNNIKHHAKRMIFVTFQKEGIHNTQRQQQTLTWQQVMSMMLAF